MSQATVRRFEVMPSQYELFRFSVPRSTTLSLRMVATDPVNVVLLDADDRADYESGNPRYTYQNAWGRRSYLEDAIEVPPGTWYIAIEGREQASKGRLEVYQ
jgi:hypothetical protein